MVFPFFTASSEVPKLRPEDQKARNALLADIQQGTRLRKVTQINDRSAPQIEKPKGAARDGVNPAINKGGSQPPLGGLFAGGFPVLRPAGQREMPGSKPGQLPGARAAAPKPSAPPNGSAARPSGSASLPAEGPRVSVPPEPPGTSRAGAGASPGRPSLPAPPPPPPASSKPTLTFPPPPALPPPAERPLKAVSPGAAPPPPPPPPQADKHKCPAATAQPPPPPPPPPPPLPLVPACGFPGRTADSSAAAASSPPEGRDCPPPAPPPPPPPPPHSHSAAPNRLSFPPSPALSGALGNADVPPPLPPKSPHLLSQLHKPSSIQSLPLPPTPSLPQPAAAAETRKRRPGRGAGTGAGKLATPPQPPARSPTTELTSKSGVSAWAAPHDPYPPLKNGNMHIIDDFESKFTFHSVEDFPPPDEFKPFQKVYPSKIARDPSKNPPLRTHVR
ncbi:WAS/WASL-interacting protein family member 3 isoform X2 [Melanerpes formicivorus]|uniref:WAS/WASL-interacting protein family member 3 isoform X2 n=1 Tax=Melanerpes formicivorus TaxID=211600 RepID=UPI00358E4533